MESENSAGKASVTARADRAWRSCLRSVLEDLQHSVAHSRQMTLPDVLRCFERRCRSCELPDDHVEVMLEEGCERLRQFYFRHQPFEDDGCWEGRRIERWLEYDAAGDPDPPAGDIDPD